MAELSVSVENRGASGALVVSPAGLVSVANKGTSGGVVSAGPAGGWGEVGTSGTCTCSSVAAEATGAATEGWPSSFLLTYPPEAGSKTNCSSSSSALAESAATDDTGAGAGSRLSDDDKGPEALANPDMETPPLPSDS